MTALHPLTPGDVSRIQLRFNSHFTRSTLADHAVEFPQLAWRNDQYEYTVGGTWKGRGEIGELIEVGGPYRGFSRVLSGGVARAPATSWQERREALVEHLVRSYARLGAGIVLLSDREAERSLSWYEALGWHPIEEIVYYYKSDVDAPPSNGALEVVPMTGRDLDRLMRLEQETFPWLWWYGLEEWASITFAPSTETYLAYADDTLVGYETHTVRNNRGHLDRLGIHPAWQGRRLGADLLSYAIQRMDRQGARTVGLSTQWNNERSQRLYERYGFVRVAGSQMLYGRVLSPDAEAHLRRDDTRASRRSGRS